MVNQYTGRYLFLNAIFLRCTTISRSNSTQSLFFRKSNWELTGFRWSSKSVISWALNHSAASSYPLSNLRIKGWFYKTSSTSSEKTLCLPISLSTNLSIHKHFVIVNGSPLGYSPTRYKLIACPIVIVDHSALFHIILYRFRCQVW